MARKVQFVETVLRDANQSLIATRLPYEKFEPMLETIDKAGFYAAECWGGATFDVCLRYLNEDPWERLRKIRAKMPNDFPLVNISGKSGSHLCVLYKVYAQLSNTFPFL